MMKDVLNRVIHAGYVESTTYPACITRFKTSSLRDNKARDHH